MIVTPQSSTAIVLTEPALERGSGKFVSKSLLEEPDINSYFALHTSSARLQSNTAELIIESIGNLQVGWDGYGATPVSSDVCANAKKFLFSSPSELSTPEITPTSSGTMNLEWTSNNADAYLEIGRTRYTGHIQSKNGETIYLDGSLTEQRSQDSGIRQALALISGLLHAKPTAPSLAQSIQVTE